MSTAYVHFYCIKIHAKLREEKENQSGVCFVITSYLIEFITGVHTISFFLSPQQKAKTSFKCHISVLLSAIGFNVETVQYKNLKFQVWDLGGQTSIRYLLLSYFIWGAFNFLFHHTVILYLYPLKKSDILD